MRNLFLALVLASPIAGASQLPNPLLGLAPELVKQGSGTLRFFGFQVYDATLWRHPEGLQPSAPFALELRYHRRISAQQLIARSLEEMARLTDASPATLHHWQTLLTGVLVDVAPGDRLIGLVDSGGTAWFAKDRQILGHLTDPALIKAFFDIWLHPDTSEPQLRAALLGLSEG